MPHYHPTPFHSLRLASCSCLCFYSQNSFQLWNYPEQGLRDESPGQVSWALSFLRLPSVIGRSDASDTRLRHSTDSRPQWNRTAWHRASL